MEASPVTSGQCQDSTKESSEERLPTSSVLDVFGCSTGQVSIPVVSMFNDVQWWASIPVIARTTPPLRSGWRPENYVRPTVVAYHGNGLPVYLVYHEFVIEIYWICWAWSELSTWALDHGRLKQRDPPDWCSCSRRMLSIAVHYDGSKVTSAWLQGTDWKGDASASSFCHPTLPWSTIALWIHAWVANSLRLIAFGFQSVQLFWDAMLTSKHLHSFGFTMNSAPIQSCRSNTLSQSDVTLVLHRLDLMKVFLGLRPLEHVPNRSQLRISSWVAGQTKSEKTHSWFIRRK